ncbi:MAG: 2-oxo acid dehydrogenase subunit E2, partial [Caldilineae bacterium]
TIPVRGVRQVVAERMLASVQSTAQLTLHTHADATRLRALRARLKSSPREMGLQDVTINHLVLFAVARSLLAHPALNAHFQGDAIHQFRTVHLGVAVDAPRGLMVPVVRHAERRSLKNLAEEARRLTEACRSGRITPDELSGGTFTVTNLGAFGVESFTPILNPPQVAILGVGAIRPQPVEEADGGVGFAPHMGLSLTIDHQAVDGAQAARFLQTLAHNLAQIDLLLAM